MIVYKITNLQTGKIYVGKTNKNLETRFLQHVRNGRKIHGSSLICKSLREYGTINHKIEILEQCKPSDNILEREQHWIDKLDSLHLGYNIKNEYLVDTPPEYWGDSEKAAKNLSEGTTWNKGISPPTTTRNKISKTKKRKHELGLYKDSYGHKHTEETKKKLSIIAENRAPASEETRKKISLSSENREFFYNPNEKKRINVKKGDPIPRGYIRGKGTCWVNKDEKSLSIDIWDKEKYIEQNYKEGRVNVGKNSKN
jgi:group I intron endonuclease